jgi:hypothetical protein
MLGAGFWVLAAGRWVLGTGYWSLGSGRWVLGTGHWLLVTGFWVLVTGFWGLVTRLDFIIFNRNGKNKHRTSNHALAWSNEKKYDEASVSSLRKAV